MTTQRDYNAEIQDAQTHQMPTALTWMSCTLT